MFAALLTVTALQDVESKTTGEIVLFGGIVVFISAGAWSVKRLERLMECPKCKKSIVGLKANIAIATDKCPNCGETILEN